MEPKEASEKSGWVDGSLETSEGLPLKRDTSPIQKASRLLASLLPKIRGPRDPS